MNSVYPMTKDLHKIYAGGTIVFISLLINSGNQYLLILIMGKVLGPAEVGLFFMGRAIMNLICIGGTFGLPGSLLKYIPEYLSRKQYGNVKMSIKFAFLATFSISLIMALLLYSAANVISIHLFKDQALIPVLRLFAICLPAFSILKILVSSIRAFRDMVAFSIVEKIVLPGGMIVFTLLFFIYSITVQVIVVAFLLSILTSILIGAIILNKKLPEKGSNLFSTINYKEVINYSIPFMGSNYMGFALLWMDSFMLGILMNAEAVGIYTGAIKIALMSKILLVSINSIFAPTISKLYSKGDLRGIESVYKATCRWIIHLSMPAFLIILFFPKTIMGFYGPQFTQGSTALMILCLGQLVSLSVGPAGSLLNMTGRAKVEFFNRSLALILNIFLNLYLIPLMGINGAALATASSTSLVNLLRLVENYRYLYIHPFSFRIIYPFTKK